MGKRRPTIADRLAFIVARSHSERLFKQFVSATRKATEVQRRSLLAKIRRNADSGFGRDFRFDRIQSVDDFRRRLPVLRYEDIQPYIEQVKLGDTRAMFGPRQRVHMFALTSGSTDTPKFVPVTDAFLAEYRRGWNAFGVKALLDHPGAFLRCILQVASRMDETRTPAGIPCGAITGLIAAHQKRLVKRYYICPPCIGRIDDSDAKYYTIMRLGVPTDVAFLITASPATQLKLARTADTHKEQLIRDVRDGTLWSDLPVPDEVREALRPRLVPEPAEAKRLERIASEHGRLLPQHYWDLKFLANWTGGTMGLHLREFPEWFGDVPVRDVGLLASEGRMSMPIEDWTPAGILDVVNNFFEFVPRDRIDDSSPPTFLSGELEVGQEYFILLTNSAGFYRYDLRDLVRVVGYYNEAPIIEFLNKGNHICSLSGEKLTEHQVILAMDRARRKLGISIDNFVLAPRWGDPPYYTLHVEAERFADPHWVPRLAEELDRELAAVNLEYAGKRKSHRLDPVGANLLPTGYLAQRDREWAESRRPGNEQYKHQYLYVECDQDKEFPTQPAVPAATNAARTSADPAHLSRLNVPAKSGQARNTQP
jgi:hypothetical protein